MVPGPHGRKVRGPRWGKGDRWQARWIEAGRERSASYPTKDGAEQHLLRVAIEGGEKPERPDVTVEEYAELWQRQQLHYTAATASAVRYKLRANVYPHIGFKLLAEVTRRDVQEMVGLWTGAPATIRQSFSFLHSLFKTAVEDGLVDSNPCVGVNLPKKRKVQVRPLTVEQVQTIADRIGERYRALVVVGAATGLRGGELRGLTADRIHDGVLRVDRQLVDREDGEPVFAAPKSESSVRSVSLGSVAAAELAAHMERWPPSWAGGVVFTTRQGGPVTRKVAGEQWRHAIDGLGLPPRTGLHSLRHFHASALIRAGLSPTAVAHRLGHADPSITLAVYGHLWPDDESRATAAIDEILGG